MRKALPEKQQNSPHNYSAVALNREMLIRWERFAKTFISTNKVRPQSEHLAPGTDLGTSGLFNVSREDRLPAKAEAQAIPKAMARCLASPWGPGSPQR